MDDENPYRAPQTQGTERPQAPVHRREALAFGVLLIAELLIIVAATFASAYGLIGHVALPWVYVTTAVVLPAAGLAFEVNRRSFVLLCLVAVANTIIAGFLAFSIQ